MSKLYSLSLVAACAAPISPPRPPALPMLALEISVVSPEPLPLLVPSCTASPIDAATRRQIEKETLQIWDDAHERNFRDYSVITATLPTLQAAWRTRTSVPYRGVVPAYLHVSAAGPLQLGLVDPMTYGEAGGGAARFDLLPTSEPSPNRSFEPLWTDPKTGRSVGPIHAAINVRPQQKDAFYFDRTQVVIYNAPSRPDILLVATKHFRDTDWTPLLRVDLPKATRFSVLQMAYPH